MKTSFPADTAAPAADDAFSRRGLLRWGLAGGAAVLGSPAFATQAPGRGGADGPAAGGTLAIGADADPIGLDPTTVTAFSSYDFTALHLYRAAALERAR